MKGLDKKHTYITHRYRQQCGDSQRERRAKRGWGAEENGTEREFLMAMDAQCSVQMVFV